MTETRDQLLSRIFSCTRCGFCCQGETTVSLDEADQERQARALGLDREEAARRYWRISGNVVQMRTVDGHCIHYDREQGCAIHAGRPWRCAQWPLHPSILDDEHNFLTIRASCPGIDREISYEEFCRVLRRLLEMDPRSPC